MHYACWSEVQTSNMVVDMVYVRQLSVVRQEVYPSETIPGNLCLSYKTDLVSLDSLGKENCII